MKTIYKAITFIGIFSLLSLSSCGSTSGGATNSAPDTVVTEIFTKDSETAPEDLAGGDAIPSPRTEANEIKNQEPEPDPEEIPAEKVDDADILQNPVYLQETTVFVEPEVIDGPEEPEQVPADLEENQNDDSVSVIETSSEPAKSTDYHSSTDSSRVSHNLNSTTPSDTKANNDDASDSFDTTSTGTGVLSTENISTDKENKTEEAVSNENITKTDSEENSQTDKLTSPAVIIPSRSMTVKLNQFVDVVYPGSGWIYVGETDETPKFRYFGRKLGSENTTFSLRSIKSGSTYLHFYKNDVLTGKFIDDYLEVEVINEKARPNEKASAPAYASFVPPKPVRTVTNTPTINKEEKTTSNTVSKQNHTSVSPEKENYSFQSKDESTYNSDSNLKTIIQAAEDTFKNPIATDANESISSVKSVQDNTNVFQSFTPINTEPSDRTDSVAKSVLDRSRSLLEQAKESLQAGNHQLALTQIQAYLDEEPAKPDEAYYIQGQILEADSPVKNIRNALDSYNSVVKNYPTSKFWQKANKRKIYLNKFYMGTF